MVEQSKVLKAMKQLETYGLLIDSDISLADFLELQKCLEDRGMKTSKILGLRLEKKTLDLKV